MLVKYGVDVAKNELELPRPLISELETLEECMKSELTGHFTYRAPTFSSQLDIAWSNGEWTFTPLNQQPISIRAGRRQDLGLAGGELFLFNNRKISINDFKMDLKGRRIFFFGKCSSSKTPEDRQFLCRVSFFKVDNLDLMEMRSVVLGEAGLMKVQKRWLQSASSLGYGFMVTDNPFDTDSESDSSVDFVD